MSLLTKLKRLNLSDNQARVYLALMQVGQGTALAVSKQAGLAKSTTFETLRTLNRKGLLPALPGAARIYSQWLTQM